MATTKIWHENDATRVLNSSYLDRSLSSLGLKFSSRPITLLNIGVFFSVGS